MRLTQDQIDQFHRDGFLALREALTATDLNPLIEDLETLIDEVAREWLAEGKIKNLHANEPFERRIASLTHAAGEPVHPRPRQSSQRPRCLGASLERSPI